MSRDEILALASYRQNNFNERYGQAVFNAVSEFFPAEARMLAGALIDPFYKDQNVDAFLERLGII